METAVEGMMEKKKMRESNIELLRLVAMFLILVVHADFFTLGIPDDNFIGSHPGESFMRFLIQAIALVCVDVFVLISGWYGIKFSIKGLCKFIYLCLFFSLGIYAVMVITGLTESSKSSLAGCFFVNEKYYWFVKAYILLYILAPALNFFVEKSGKEMHKTVLLCFYIFHTLYGWLTSGAAFLQYGYSTCSLIGLYLLSAYIRRYRPSWTTMKMKGGFFFLFAVVCLVEGLLPLGASVMFHNKGLTGFMVAHVFAYSSPLVILSSIYLLLAFNSMKVFYSKIINWMAISCFAACLLHGHHCVVGDYFSAQLKEFYSNSTFSIYILKMLALCFVYFIAAIPIDKFRIASFDWITRKIKFQ